MQKLIYRDATSVGFRCTCRQFTMSVTLTRSKDKIDSKTVTRNTVQGLGLHKFEQYLDI